MDRQGFIDFNTRRSPENSGKADSYARAFDRGLITFSPDDYTVRLSFALREYETQEYYDRHFGKIRGQKITLPGNYKPSQDFLAYYRDYVFVGL